MQLTPAQIAFLQWLAMNQPEVYNRAMRAMAQQGLSGILDLDTSAWLADFNAGLSTGSTTTAQTQAWWEKLVPMITGIGQAVVTVKSQNDLLKLNLERAKKGLEPLTAQQAGVGLGVNLSVDPATTRAAGIAAAVPLVLLGIGAYFLVSRR